MVVRHRSFVDRPSSLGEAHGSARTVRYSAWHRRPYEKGASEHGGGLQPGCYRLLKLLDQKIDSRERFNEFFARKLDETIVEIYKEWDLKIGDV